MPVTLVVRRSCGQNGWTEIPVIGPDDEPDAGEDD